MKKSRKSKKAEVKNEAKAQEKPGVTHGELRPIPEVAPMNENKQEENTESLVTAPEISVASFAVENDGLGDLQGRAMGVVAPKKP